MRKISCVHFVVPIYLNLLQFSFSGKWDADFPVMGRLYVKGVGKKVLNMYRCMNVIMHPKKKVITKKVRPNI